MYDILHVLHVTLCIPLMLWSWYLSDVFGYIHCCIVFMLLNAMHMLVCLKRLESFLIFGLWYVKIAHFLVLFSSLSLFWWIFLCCFCIFKFVVSFLGKLLFCAMACIVFHSACCLSIVSGSEYILVIWYWYAAMLCSVGWLDRKLIVVLVVVVFRCISISRLEGFLIIRRSRKFMWLLLSCVGLSWRFGCICFMYKVVQMWPGHMRLVCTQISPSHIWTTLYLWTVLGFVNFVSYIRRISSTYLA